MTRTQKIIGSFQKVVKSTKLPINNLPDLYISYSTFRSILSLYSLKINFALLNNVVIKKLNKSPLDDVNIFTIHCAEINKKLML